ncbi:hypothetical protein L2E82_38778 [Cichorium intybus]|uniref:Uncharacterized protein n=1 Tax=Cichorium intybus TaxID=13427 RepID=A0ACB9AGH1_CICIN|nr:hypothetical protein L2E82_38778 [Cichorium intybus]
MWNFKALNKARLEANVRMKGDQNYGNKWPSPYAVVCGVLLLLSFLKYVYSPFKWLALGAVAVGIVPLTLKAIASLRIFRFDINVLMLIAGTATAVMSSLMNIAPQTAVLADTGEEVNASEVKVNTRLAVKAGTMIPIDGVVVEGKCEVDEKTLTGESFPVCKQLDSIVWAGTLNLTGYISVKTTVVAEACVVAKMAKLVEEAQNNKSKTQRYVDEFAKYYTPAVCVVAACLAAIPAAMQAHNLDKWYHLALVVLVSACPCALILSTPIAAYCALSKAAKSGLLVKGAEYLEILSAVKFICFDKTGTITRGEFSVSSFQPLINNDNLLYWVSSIECKSSHPMAEALVNYAQSHSVKPQPNNVGEFKDFPGEGIYGKIDGNDVYIGNQKIAVRAGCSQVSSESDNQGRSTGYIFLGSSLAGIFSLSDSCRIGVRKALEELKSMGIKTAMLTGDCQEAADYAQNQAGVISLAIAGHPLVWAAVLADMGTCLLVIFNSMLLLRGVSSKTMENQSSCLRNDTQCLSSSKAQDKCCDVGGCGSKVEKNCCDVGDFSLEIKEKCCDVGGCCIEVKDNCCIDNGCGSEVKDKCCDVDAGCCSKVNEKCCNVGGCGSEFKEKRRDMGGCGLLVEENCFDTNGCGSIGGCDLKVRDKCCDMGGCGLVVNDKCGDVVGYPSEVKDNCYGLKVEKNCCDVGDFSLEIKAKCCDVGGYYIEVKDNCCVENGCGSEVKDKFCDVDGGCCSKVNEKCFNVGGCGSEFKEKRRDMGGCGLVVEENCFDTDGCGSMGGCDLKVRDKCCDMGGCGLVANDKCGDVGGCPSEVKDNNCDMGGCGLVVKDKCCNVDGYGSKVQEKCSDVGGCDLEVKEKLFDMGGCSLKVKDKCCDMDGCGPNIQDKCGLAIKDKCCDVGSYGLQVKDKCCDMDGGCCDSEVKDTCCDIGGCGIKVQDKCCDIGGGGGYGSEVKDNCCEIGSCGCGSQVQEVQPKVQLYKANQLIQETRCCKVCKGLESHSYDEHVKKHGECNSHSYITHKELEKSFTNKCCGYQQCQCLSEIVIK